MQEKRFQKALTFSYDDGVEQDRRLVEMLNRYGMKATFNLNTGIQTEESYFEIEGIPIHRMNPEGLQELYRGHEIAVHGLTHAALTGMNREQLRQELLQDAENIEAYYGAYPRGMAYAYGAYEDNVKEYLSEIGIQYARTVESSYCFSVPEDLLQLRPTCHHNDERLFELARQFLDAEPEPGQQMIFFVWGHSYEFDIKQNWDRLEEFCQMFSHRDIYYGTNAQCLQMFQQI